MKRAWVVLIAGIALTLAAITYLTIRPAHADPLPCGPVPVLLKKAWPTSTMNLRS